MKLLSLLLTLLLVCLTEADLHAQPHGLILPVGIQTPLRFAPLSYGIIAEGDLNFHHANFQRLPDVPSCCPQYEVGSGFGPGGGVFVRDVLTGTSAVILRAVYASYNGTLTANEPTSISVNHVVTPAMIQHTLYGGFTTAELDPIYEYEIVPRLSLMAGANVGLIVGKSYAQHETLIQPTNTGTFDNGLRTRNNYSGTIAEASSLFAGVLGGASYALPLNSDRTLEAVPEVLYDLGLTPFVRGLTWNVSSIRFGLSIRYSVPEQVAQPPVIAQAPVLPPQSPPVASVAPKPKLRASVAAEGVESNGTQTRNAVIRVEEFYSTQMTPLLPYIFFQKGSATIPSRYSLISNAASFNASQLSVEATNDRLALYHNLLNIIGERMRAHPEASLEITGCSSDESADSLALAKARAESVAQYLHEVWNIQESHLHTAVRGLPEHPSTLGSEDGIEENRRVELSSRDPDILDPIQTSDTIRTATPPVIRFSTSAKPSDAITKWKLEVGQQSILLKQFAGSGPVPDSIDWKLGADPAHIPHAAEPLRYKLKAYGTAGDSIMVVDSLNVEQTTLRQKRIERVADKEIDKYTLILFNFGSTTLDAANRRQVEYIKQQISPGTTIDITGHTDRTGEAAPNLKISESRAQATADLLGKNDAHVEGLGKNILLYNNDLPEGRFYSRTVDITLEKPKEK